MSFQSLPVLILILTLIRGLTNIKTTINQEPTPLYRLVHMSYTSIMEIHEHVPIAESTMAAESVGQYLFEILVNNLDVHEVVLIDLVLRIHRLPTRREVRNDVANISSIKNCMTHVLLWAVVAFGYNVRRCCFRPQLRSTVPT